MARWCKGKKVKSHGKLERIQNLSVCLCGAAHREQHRDGGLPSGPHRRRGGRPTLLRGAVVPVGGQHLRSRPVHQNH